MADVRLPRNRSSRGLVRPGHRLGSTLLASLVGWLVTSSAMAQTPAVGAPPRVLNITHVRLKPQSSGHYTALEAQVVRAFERARAQVYWIGLQAPRDANDILYLNLFDSSDALDRATASYREAARRHAELDQLQKRVSELTATQNTMLTTRRDDLDRPLRGVTFATMRTLRLTTFQVRPGREGTFVQALRTATPKEGVWLVYEANDSPTFLLLTLKRTPIGKRDGPAVPRTLRHSGAYTRADTRIYSVRPGMSHVPPAFAAANPQLWRVPPVGTH